MSSEPAPSTAYVWVWLPGAGGPIVAGRVDPVGTRYAFTYGRTYLERADAVSLYTVADECSLALMPLSRLARGRSRSDCVAACRVDASQPPAPRRVSYGRLHVRLGSPRHSRRH